MFTCYNNKPHSYTTSPKRVTETTREARRQLLHTVDLSCGTLRKKQKWAQDTALSPSLVD